MTIDRFTKHPCGLDTVKSCVRGQLGFADDKIAPVLAGSLVVRLLFRQPSTSRCHSSILYCSMGQHGMCFTETTLLVWSRPVPAPVGWEGLQPCGLRRNWILSGPMRIRGQRPSEPVASWANRGSSKCHRWSFGRLAASAQERALKWIWELSVVIHKSPWTAIPELYLVLDWGDGMFLHPPVITFFPKVTVIG